MTRKENKTFDAKTFLRTVGEGRTISKYRKNKTVFSQGDPANAVYYIHQGKVKVSVLSQEGKEAVVGILGRGAFLGEGCLNH